jgi:hypothetical protein
VPFAPGTARYPLALAAPRRTRPSMRSAPRRVVGRSPPPGRWREGRAAPRCSWERLPVREEVRPAVGGHPHDGAAIERDRVVRSTVAGQRRLPDPSAFITSSRRGGRLPASVAYTILPPSGDHAGAMLNPRCRVSRLRPLPSTFATQISYGPSSGFLARTKATLLPSGDQLESPSMPGSRVAVCGARARLRRFRRRGAGRARDERAHRGDGSGRRGSLPSPSLVRCGSLRGGRWRAGELVDRQRRVSPSRS